MTRSRPFTAIALALLLLLSGSVAASTADPSPAAEAKPAPWASAVAAATAGTRSASEAPLAVASATPSAAVAPPDPVRDLMDEMSLREKVGQLFLSRIYGYRADDPAPGAQRSNRRYLGVADAAGLFERYPVGAIVYFDYTGNLQRPAQIARLSNGIQRAAIDAGTVPVLISTDQEHGLIERLGPPATRFPGSMALGATRDPGLARQAARVTGEELRAVGIRQDLAPVADVNSDPDNPVIGVRSFGSRPALVADLTVAQVAGFQEDTGVAATVKHFPGHGDTDVDSHLGLPTVRHSKAGWWDLDAPPFQAAIDAGAEVVMTAHVRVPSLDPSGRPATLSRPILSGILRGRMGFEGVIMTDSLTMAGVRQRYGDDRIPVLALKAGADLLADPPHLPTAFGAVMRAVRTGELSLQRIDRSVQRILRLKERLGLLDDPLVDADAAAASLGTPEHLAVARTVGQRSVTVLRDRRDWLPLSPRWSIALTGPRPEGAQALADGLRASGRTVEPVWTGPNPNRGRIRGVARATRAHDLVVVVTTHLGPSPGQRALVRQLLAGGQRVIVVFGSSPYDTTWLPGAPAQIATYSTVPASMAGLAAVLEGDTVANGRLPVRIPQPGRPGASLFDFGRGLRP